MLVLVLQQSPLLVLRRTRRLRSHVTHTRRLRFFDACCNIQNSGLRSNFTCQIYTNKIVAICSLFVGKIRHSGTFLMLNSLKDKTLSNIENQTESQL